MNDLNNNKNNKTNNKGVFFVIGCLCVAVVALSIAYAALSTTLNINFGNVTQSQQSWSVGFLGSTATGTATGTSQTGLTCGDATITSDSVSIANTSISKPGDKCVYQFTIKNNGTINANLQTITPVTPSGLSCTSNGASMVCGNITYKLSTDNAGATLLTSNTGLNSNDTLDVYLTAEYTGLEVSNSPEVQTGAGFTLIYNQA